MHAQMFPELDHKEQPPVGGDGGYITEEIMKQVTSKVASWKNSNLESLGQLWLGLLKYVCMYVYI